MKFKVVNVNGKSKQVAPARGRGLKYGQPDRYREHAASPPQGGVD